MFAALETLFYIFYYNFRKEQRDYVFFIASFTYLEFILVTGRPM